MNIGLDSSTSQGSLMELLVAETELLLVLKKLHFHNWILCFNITSTQFHSKLRNNFLTVVLIPI